MDSQEKYWYSFLTVCIIFIILFVTHIITSDKDIRYYYLADSTTDGLSIGVDIDNYPDDCIGMNGHTIQEVVAIIDSLNKSLPK